MLTTQHDWLDKHIIDQANHWGCSPADKARLFASAAEFDEMLTAGVVEEPTEELACNLNLVKSTDIEVVASKLGDEVDVPNELINN